MSQAAKITQTQPAPATLQLLRLPDVLARVGLSRSTWYNLVREKRAPSPINLGGSAVAWIDTEINEWIASRIAESRGVQTQKETHQ